MRAMRVYVPMLAITHCESARLAETLAEESEHAFCPAQWHPSLDYHDEWFGSAADFAKFYRLTYGVEVPYQAAQSAAAVLVFADAFARAQSLERAKAREALRHTERETFFGRIKFDAAGRNIGKPMVLTQLRNGRYVVVRTRARAGDEPVIPRPRQ
jgi:branched-chain amino acid transport system substrate-binding protein